MGLFKTKTDFFGGGPLDGAERILPNGQRILLTARLYIRREKNGALAVIQDALCAHCYLRVDEKRFRYDGLHILTDTPPVPVEARSFT